MENDIHLDRAQEIAEFFAEMESFLAATAEEKEAKHQLGSLFAENDEYLDDTISPPPFRRVIRLQELRTPRLFDKLRQTFNPTLN